MSTFYRPEDGVAGDFIPFYWKGNYHLFYLKDYRDEKGHGQGTPWFHIVTRDFVDFEDWGEALPRGPAGSQDVWVFTGSVIERDGTFHIFYTGHNGNFANTPKPIQGVMHARSPDLRNWTRDPSFMFFAPASYEKDDWRDPFVFWNEEAREYWMLLAARRPSGPKWRRGCTALAASRDLKEWEVREPLWAPDFTYAHECPDLFRIGEWWYFVYSTVGPRLGTRYRMSKSLKGPWLCPPNETFDAHLYYAAKSAGDGKRRFIFGWLPTRAEEKDDGTWQWGGNLVVHEIVQEEDGTLSVRLPETIAHSFRKPVTLTRKPILGEWKVNDGTFETSSISRLSALALGTMPEECLIEASITFSEGTSACGFILRADEDIFESYYEVRLEPMNRRLVFDRWPRPWDQVILLERPLELVPGKPVRLRAIADGTCLVVYANDKVALSARMYDHRAGALALFVSEGEAKFQGVSVKTRT